MKYKLLLVDFDGTLTTDLGMPPIEYIPSPHLFNVVQEGLRHISFSLCTGRDKKTVINVIKKLNLTSPQIIEGGAKIISSSGKEIWTKYISRNVSNVIVNLLKKTETSFSVIVDGIEIINTIPFKNFDKITAVLWYDLNKNQVGRLRDELSSFKDINIAVNQDRSGNTIYITHKEGTKSHGVKSLLSLLRVKKAFSLDLLLSTRLLSVVQALLVTF